MNRANYMATTTYLIGDATTPIGNGVKIIPHICNDIGAWGSGFVVAVTNRFGDAPRKTYLQSEKVLGSVTFCEIDQDKIVANMVAQRDIRWYGLIPPIRYDALTDTMTAVAKYALDKSATIHCPRFGAGLAGGDWNRISDMIKVLWNDQGIDVFVYDLPIKQDLSELISQRKQ